MIASGAARVLAGLKVVDLCNDRAGSVAGMLLADLGADVVRVEGSDGQHRRPPPIQLPDAVCWDRHKRTQVAAQLDPQGDVGLHDLLDAADVALVDGSPEAMRDSKLSPHTLSERD